MITRRAFLGQAASVLTSSVLGVPFLQPKGTGVEPEFFIDPAIRRVSASLPPTLADIESRMPVNHDYRHADLETWAHETTHGLHARLRGYRGTHNACYCLGGRYVVLPEPRITLAQVAAAVPVKRRGSRFRNYLVSQQRWWNRQPLYIFDEWFAYYNDALVARELGRKPQDGAWEFTYYAEAVALTAGFRNLPLWRLFLWQVDRVAELYGRRP